MSESVKVLGLWSGHDCSFCTLTNGRPTHHSELERHIRVKEPPGDSIAVFYQHDGDVADITALATCHRAVGIQEHTQSWQKIRDVAPLHVVGHHQAHAANAFFSSNFNEATIVTIDGGGIENDRGLCVGSSIWRGNNNKIENILYAPIDRYNVGGVWTRATKYIFRLESGWPQGHQAGTVMAMAALGDPTRWVNDFKKMFKEDLSRTVMQPQGHVKGMSSKDPKSPRHPFLGQFEDLIKGDVQASYDMAAALQSATEKEVHDIIEYAFKMRPTTNLCLSGGVFLNSVVVGKIQEWFPSVTNVYVPPVPYDGGLTIGAAQYAWHHVLDHKRVLWIDNATPFLGNAYDPSQAITDAILTGKLQVADASDDKVLNLLASGKIVAVYHGRSESGRRALGNRSILADPRRAEMKDIVNEKVKHRQHFRPFAPSVLREDVSEWFTRDVNSPYMSFVLKFQENKKHLVPAVVHFDGSARLQTVTENDNAWYYNFIKKWKALTGIPMLLNTSFNDREPICETPHHAINCFLGTEIDYLYFPDHGTLCSR